MKSIIFLLLIFPPTILFAQSNYQAGYVLKNNGDTVKGFINYHEWDVSPKSIDFKANINDKSTIEFFPGDIRKFIISGFENYSVFSGAISMAKTDVLNARTFDTTKQNVTVFLRQLVTGRYLTLFYYRDDIKVRFFIAEADSLPVELKYAVYYDEQNQLIKSEIYKGQLRFYLNKYAHENNKLRNVIEQLKYEKEDLDFIVDNINNIDGKVTKKQVPFRLFAGAALAQTVTTLTNGVPNSTSILPKINFGIDLFANPNIQQFFFRAELSLSYINPKFVYSKSSLVVVDPGYTEYYSFNQYTAAITPQIVFNVYNTNKLKVYIDGGLALNFSIYSNNIFTTQSSSSTATTTAASYHLEPYWVGIPLQAGVAINKKIEVFSSYMPFAYYSKYVYFPIGNRVTSFGVKFLFGNKKVYNNSY